MLLHLHFSFAAAAVTATTTATAKQLVFCMGATVCVCMCVCVCSMHVHVHWKICIYPVALRPSSDSTSSINRPTGTGEFLAPFSHSLLLLPIFGCAFCFCFLVFFFLSSTLHPPFTDFPLDTQLLFAARIDRLSHRAVCQLIRALSVP